MNSNTYKTSGNRTLMTATVLLLAAGTLAVTALNPFTALRRARMADHVGHARQIKLVLDVFAMDYDGVYPNSEAAQFYELPEPKTSNDYFKQLFAAGLINSEQLFWVGRSKVCNEEKPDDITTNDGVFAREKILPAGDCGWAYMTTQKTVDDPRRPILLDAYLPGTKNFDPKIWDEKVIVARIDGSVKMEIIRANNALIEKGENILAPKTKMWPHQDPTKLLTQPKPSKAAQAKIDAAKKAEAAAEE